MDFDDGDFNVLTNDNKEPQNFGLNEHTLLDRNRDENNFLSRDGSSLVKNRRLHAENDDLVERRSRNFANFGDDNDPPASNSNFLGKRKSNFDIFNNPALLDASGKHPIDWHESWNHGMSKEEERKSKRAKMESEYLDRLMERIEVIKARKVCENQTDQDLDEFGDEFRAKIVRETSGKVYSLIPQNAGNWIRISAPDREQHFYVVTNRSGMNTRSEIGAVGNCYRKSARSILGKNFQELLDEANEIRCVKAVSGPESEIPCTLDVENLEPLEEAVGSGTNESKKVKTNGDLWVEKYRPRMYTDLLSDDGINRTLLTWLKLWDECVFNRKAPSSRKKNDKDLSQQTKIADKFQTRKETKWRKKYAAKFDADELSKELDAYKRPENKIALLCGAPGMGKTTLANIIARVAGYHVVELNASDDRTLDHFKTALEGATQMKSTLDADPRPNCLVIDEIDGAPLASINYLLNIAKGDSTVGKKRIKKVLKRPVICICNDLYVPALRELRKVALVLPFPVTSTHKLADRLQYVCRRENLATDHKTLEALCDKTCQDIRACLNTIQFASSTKRAADSVANERRLCIADVENTALGQKDSQKTLFNVWHQIFEMPKLKGKIHLGQIVSDPQENITGLKNSRSPKVRFETIYRLVLAAGDGEKLRRGIFDNFLGLKLAESDGMELIDVGLNWFCLVDSLSTMVNRSQVYELLRYTSFLPVIFHLMFASNAYPTVQFPHSQYDAMQKTQKSTNILTSVLDAALPTVYQQSDRESLPLEILPYVADVIQPNLRPVNMQLYSAKEKAELCQIIKVMLQYSVTYRQQRSVEGTYEFVLEPAIDTFETFPDSKPGKQLSYSAKQMIAREIELERMRRTETYSISVKMTGQTEDFAMETRTSEKPQRATMTKNHLQYLQPKNISATEDSDASQAKTPRMFFAPKFGPNKGKSPDSLNVKPHQTGIWFKFNEGYSNAIRKNIRMRDLL